MKVSSPTLVPLAQITFVFDSEAQQWIFLAFRREKQIRH